MPPLPTGGDGGIGGGGGWTQLYRHAVAPDGTAEAKVDFLDRSGVAEHLHEGARFLFMAGRRVLADAEVTSVLWRPDD